MIDMGAFIVIVWLAGAVLLVWPARCVFLKSDLGSPLNPTEPNGEELFFAAFVGGILALAWPIALTGFLAFRLSRRIWDGPKVKVDR
jgi:hypothetical protein